MNYLLCVLGFKIHFAAFHVVTWRSCPVARGRDLNVYCKMAPRGFAHDHVEAIAQAYHECKTSGTGLKILMKKFPPGILSYKTASAYRTQLDAENFFVRGTTTVADVLSRVEEIYRRRCGERVRVPPQDDNPIDRLGRAIHAFRRLTPRPSIRKFAEASSVNRRTLTKYLEMLPENDDLETAETDTVERVYRLSSEIASRRGGHRAYFTNDEELMIVGTARAFEDAGSPFSQTQLKQIARELLKSKWTRRGVQLDEVLARLDCSNLRKWFYGFRRRNAKYLRYLLPKNLAVERALAQDPANIDGWFRRVRDLQSLLIERGKLPNSGFQPYQVRKSNYSLLAPHNECSDYEL